MNREKVKKEAEQLQDDFLESGNSENMNHGDLRKYSQTGLKNSVKGYGRLVISVQKLVKK